MDRGGKNPGVQDRKGLDLPEETAGGKMNIRALCGEVPDRGGDQVARHRRKDRTWHKVARSRLH